MVTTATVLAVIYGVAVVAKARDLGHLKEYLVPLSGRHTAPVAWLAIACETILCLALASVLIAGHIVATGAAAASAIFLLFATALHATLITRGESTDCNCFGALKLDRTGRFNPAWKPATLAMRNGMIIAASVALAGAGPPAAVAAAGLPAILIGTGLLLSFRHERRLLQEEVHPLTRTLGPTLATLQAHSWWVNGRPRPF